ncbi:MAG TPA: hypothetical protein VNP94_01195 [Actinomycetota bacterium]|nr:hypothetical protein [Actinomycetota bacterium]
MRTARWTALAVVLGLAAAGCGGGAETTVDVTLREFSVEPAQASAPAGTVTFQIRNEGPNDAHEFVVIRTDLAPDQLPTDDRGVVQEDAPGIDVVDEVEEIPVGGSATLSVDLDAGSYVLICNIYDEEEQEAHYSQGMRTAFTVE